MSSSSTPNPLTAAPTNGNRILLLAGLIAGPLFVATAALQAALRDGFDLGRHPISMLSLGDGGWIQIANFIVAGLLLMAFAVGLRRRLRPGVASRWAPILFALCGIGLIIGGAFPPDPALGFPVGAPEGILETLSFAGTVHAVAPPLAFTSLVVGIVVAGRRIAKDGHGALAVASWVIAPLCFLLSLPFWPASSITLFIAVTLGLGWVSAYAAGLLRAGAARA